MKFNFEGLEIWKWNIPTDGAQEVDEKNSVICLVTIFPCRIGNKWSKMVHFLYFMLMIAKN